MSSLMMTLMSQAARIVKGRLEKTTLGDIAEYIEEVYSPGQCYLTVKIDLAAINALQLGINAESIAKSIREHKKLRVKEGVKVVTVSYPYCHFLLSPSLPLIIITKKKCLFCNVQADSVRIYPPETKKDSLLFSMQQVPTLIVALSDAIS
jgi:hypothetical protein